jgi:anti-anti-sigma factor
MDSNPSAVFVVFDLSKLDYISSIGIGSFTAILVHGKNNSIDIYLMNLDDKCMRLFKHLGLQHFFNIIEDIKDITLGKG